MLIRALKVLVMVTAAVLCAAPTLAAPAPVHVLTVDMAIDPVVAQYIDTGIHRAEAAGASAVLIKLNTPGGLGTSMREIVQAELNARVPIIVYVSPDGARADSAGVAITLAANVAAMAPTTNIGSSHPIFTWPFGSMNSDDVIMTKVENDAAKYFRAIAERRGRNGDWAEKAVRNSINDTATDALKQNVIDFIVPTMSQLIEKADGMKVETAAGTVKLALKGAPLEEYPMPWYKVFLHYLADSTVAFLLLLIAIIGIIFEINTPGATFPGVIGGIAFILFLFSLSMLPVNYTGLILVVLALGLFIADIKVPSHGALSVGGAIAFFLGAMMLFGTSPVMGVPIAILTAGTLALTGFFVLLVGLGVRALKGPVVSGSEGMIGQTVAARTDIAPVGKIFAEGTWWTAETDDVPIKKGENVKIIAMEGLRIKVEKADETT